MPRIPDDIVEQVRTASDIVEVVGQHVQLVRRGSANYFGLCPFHKEDTPSFSVNTERQIYHCFGCNAGGNVFRFVQEVDRVSFTEAVTYLAERAGIRLPEHEAPSAAIAENDALFRANELARKYFQHLLTSDPQGHNGLSYLRRRGLDEDVIARFGLGYAPSAWDGLIQVARRRGLSAQVLEKAGLALPRRTGNGHYDRFRDRVTFPIANLTGRTIAFGARALQADQDPKYLNSPETPIYHKGSVLYGLDQAREPIRRQGRALVVEGYMDLISLSQAGVEHVVASSGTALTDDQCRLLGRYAREVLLVFDGDAAGTQAAVRGAEAALAAGLEVRVVVLPEEHDPDSYVRERGVQGLNQLLAEAAPVLEFLVQRLRQQHDLGTAAGKGQALESLRPLLTRTADPVRRDLLLREAAQRLGVDESAMRQSMQQAQRRPGRPLPRNDAGAPPATASAPPPPAAEVAFLGILLNHPRLLAATAAALPVESLTHANCRALLTLLFSHAEAPGAVDPARLVTELEDASLARLVTQCTMQGFDPDQVDAQWQDYCRHFQRESLTRQIERARDRQRQAAAAGDEAGMVETAAEIDRLVKERRALLPEPAP